MLGSDVDGDVVGNVGDVGDVVGDVSDVDAWL